LTNGPEALRQLGAFAGQEGYKVPYPVTLALR
jgi:hypothetical protein